MSSRNLDLLRSFAVLLVVGFHLSKFFNRQLPHFRVTDFGLLGVMLFFVHTTLVLMLSLERQRASSTGSLWLPFMTRRVFRIYPMAILVVLFVWVLKIPSDLQFGQFELLHQKSGNLIANLLLIQNVTRQKANPGPLWSLPLELQMYLVLPLLFLVANRVRPWWGMILFWCLIVASWFALGFATGMFPLSDGDIRSPVEALLKFTRFAPCFLPGVIAYKLWRQPKRLPALAWPIFLAFVAVYPGDIVKVTRAGIVYVVGEVGKPGGFVLTSNENISVLQALALAQGLTRTSAKSQARIIRTDPKTDQRIEIPVDLGKILASKAPDVMLQTKDIVFVPNSFGKTALYRGAEAALVTATGVAIYGRY